MNYCTLALMWDLYHCFLIVFYFITSARKGLDFSWAYFYILNMYANAACMKYCLDFMDKIWKKAPISSSAYKHMFILFHVKIH